jgi:hypothetical protein
MKLSYFNIEQNRLSARIPAMINRLVCRKLPWFIMLLLFLLAQPTYAQAEPVGLTLEARAGFDGLYRGEYWLPVVVNVANSGPPIEGEVRVYPGATADADEFVYRAPISLPTQSDKQVTLYIQLPGPATSVLVQVADANGQVLATARTRHVVRVRPENLLYGVVTPDAGEFDWLENVSGGRADAAVAYLTLADLPDIAVAWNALDVLVLNDTDTAQLTAAQLTALESWLSTGGQLVVTGGASWQKTAVPLAEWLPVTLSGSETVDDLPGLAQEVGTPFRDPGPYVITTSSLARGELLFHEEGLPVLAAVPYGRGAVYFLALDPRFAPLLDWDGAEVLFTAVANRISPLSLWGVAPYEGYAAQNAVTSLPDLNLPSVWELALFLLVYIVIVGPANYLVLKRRNRMELAWVTLPLLIVAFTAVTYFTGFQLRGNDAIINQMTVAYSQADSPQARVYSLVGLYSPRRSTYDVIFPADTLARPFENIFGSLGNTLNAESITYSNEHSIDGVRVDVSDVETFTAQTDRPAIDLSGQGTLVRQGTSILRLRVNIQNNSAETLENAALLFNDTAFPLGDLAPGETDGIYEIVSISPYSGGFNGPLTNHVNTLFGYDYYNDAKLYPRYELMQSLEGEGFGTGSALSLPRNSAVFIGWTETPAIEISLDRGTPQQTAVTLHFIEIPVTQDLTSSFSSDGALGLPTFLLNWQLLPDSTISNATPDHMELSGTGNWAGFEYTPPLELQQLPVTELAVFLEKDNFTNSLPEVRLWKWETETWELLESVASGRTAVANPTPYIGPGNTVRIQVIDTNSNYQVLTAVYPLLTVNGEE